MDSSRKPDLKNPRKGANPLSQLFFCWVMPVLWHGVHNGLNTDDLTQCLNEDNSGVLGDKLEIEWNKELVKASKKNRPPKLKNALFRTFATDVIFDGFLVFMFVLIRTLLPVVLAQLLIQFQQPIVMRSHAVASNNTIPTTTTTTIPLFSSFNDSANQLVSLNRSIRAVHALDAGHDSDDIGFNAINHMIQPTYDNIEKFPRQWTAAGSNQQKRFVAENTVDKDVSKTPVLYEAEMKSDRDEQLRSGTFWEDTKSFFVYIWNDINWLGAGVILMCTFGFLFVHHSDLRQRMVGARMRIACCSLIYRKTLRLSKKSAGHTAAGYLVNLMSNDVSRLDYGFIYAHYVWILPLQSSFVAYLIWRQIGWAALVGVVGLLIKTIPVQTGLSRWSSLLRLKVAERTDQRVGIMNEIVQGIQVIKMYAWEKPFQVVVAEARRQEVKQIRYASYIRGINLCTMVFTERSTLFITLLTCALMGQSISAEKVFSMAQFFNVLQLTAAIFYPLALALGAEALVSITRVEDLLLKEERNDDPYGLALLPKANASEKSEESKRLLAAAEKGTTKEEVKDKSNAIEMTNVSASWDAPLKMTLDEINLNVKAGTLCAIIGPVGAGKSSLLHLLLGELPIDSGKSAINGSLSYASQEPWLFTGTVRNNILFGQDYEQKRYHDVVKCCALITDFEQLPNGDRTMVGERGASLSGGQRARISLARAVYKQASVYLLDDPLSAVDAHVGKHLFDEVIGPKGRLSTLKTTRLLVTHQVHFLKEADVIIILENGRIMRQGTYSELANSNLDFAKLLEKPGDEEDARTGDSGEMYADDDIPYIDGVSGYQQLKKKLSNSTSSSKKSLKSVSSDNLPHVNDEDEEEQADGGVSLRVWRKYFAAGGNACRLISLVLMMILSQVVTSGSDYFVNYFTQQEDRRNKNEPTQLTTAECLYVYGGLILAVIIVCFLRGYMFFNICMRASKVLHNKMFRSILCATMRFFDTNPSGRILNRFSKDMGAIDEMLPRAMMESLQILLVMLGILVVVSIVNPLMIAALTGSVILFAAILKLYLRPSQDLKRLEGISRSPVFSHLSASLTGISTIRSRGLQSRLAREFDELQDVHSGIWQVTMSANTALGLWLDCVSTAFVGCVTFSFISLFDEAFSGNVGLAISQALILTGMVQYGVRQSAESMQQMTSVERVLQYTDLDQEPSLEKKPPSNWPTAGRVQFKQMSLRYDPNDAPILINLNIDIQPGWKVGIVGRTGAGKSSLISALFRLSLIEGNIEIDGIDTGTISLETLRSKVSIIPQDPVLFSATIRNNLDPFQLYSDDALWCALADVELKASIGSLDFLVTEGGANFSVGQRQLICLARAILRNNKVLVLDEATANVDPQTDALIQRTIRVKFLECTVLTVAHRLHTVMDSDRILVMDAGCAKEFDYPHLLLQHIDGLLRTMVDATGLHESESLKRIANDAYRQMQQNGKIAVESNIHDS